jgi:hypothetical protein
MTIARNGTPFTVDNTATTIAVAVSASAGDVLVLDLSVQGGPTGAAVASISSIVGGGLTWTQRSNQINTPTSGAGNDIGNGASYQQFFRYYAVAASAVVSQTITVTVSVSNAMSMSITAWSGVNSTTPWDTNGSLPAQAKSAAFNTASVPTVTGISTTNANSVLIAGVSSQDATPPTVGSGYTLDYSSLNGATYTNEIIGSQHKIVTSAQSGVSAAFGGSILDWIMTVDALQAAGGGGGGSFVPYNPWPQIGPLIAQ